MSLGKTPIKDLDKKDAEISDSKEILMEHAYLVMADLIDLSNDFHFSW